MAWYDRCIHDHGRIGIHVRLPVVRIRKIEADTFSAPTSGGQYHWIAQLAPPSIRTFMSYIMGTILFSVEEAG